MSAFQRFNIIENEKAADDLCILKMRPEDSGAVFEFKAGQFVMVHLLDENGNTVRKSPFSIASSPSESQASIDLGVRIHGPVSTSLFSSKPGDVFGIQGPYGHFTPSGSADRIVFLAAGIGITPFRAMIRQILSSGSQQKVVLMQSARSADRLAYQKEFMGLMSRHKNFTYIPILTQEKPDAWQGVFGRLDEKLLENSVQDFENAEFMLCGPASFMEDVGKMLQKKGISPKQLHLERY